MQHEWNEALAATIGKIGLCINAMGSLFAFLLEKMQFEPTAVNISVFIGFCGLLLQICVQVHAWKQRNAQNAALQRKLERDEAFHLERMKALEMGRHVAMDSTLEAFKNEAG